MLDPSRIETRYAKSGELNIAYQVFGEGDVDLVFIPGWASNVENIWTLPEFAQFAERLAQFARVILLDRRGTGHGRHDERQRDLLLWLRSRGRKNW